MQFNGMAANPLRTDSLFMKPSIYLLYHKANLALRLGCFEGNEMQMCLYSHLILCFVISRAGTPPHMLKEGMSRVTTAPAPIITFDPIVTPLII